MRNQLRPIKCYTDLIDICAGFCRDERRAKGYENYQLKDPDSILLPSTTYNYKKLQDLEIDTEVHMTDVYLSASTVCSGGSLDFSQLTASS